MGYLWPSAWWGVCRWTRNESIFRAQHRLAVVHGILWAAQPQHQMNCGGMGEGKASERVWRSNCYHTWQRLVRDPVVHAAYVSGWSSVRQSDRLWRVTRHIRPLPEDVFDRPQELRSGTMLGLHSYCQTYLDSSKCTSGVLFIEYWLDSAIIDQMRR